MNTVYSFPDHFGLEIVSCIDDPQASYEFDMMMVWRDREGRLFWAADSGCSCPEPFESYESVESLTPLTDESWHEFSQAVMHWCSWQNEIGRAHV